MTKYIPVSIDDMITEHLVRTAYMGFMLSKDANDYLRKQVYVDELQLERLINNFNNATKNDFYKVHIRDIYEGEKQLYLLGTHRYFHFNLKEKVLNQLNKLLVKNIRIIASQGVINRGKYPIVFDLNTLQPLERVGVTTMGDKYKASDNKRYMLHFFHLYSIGEQ